MERKKLKDRKAWIIGPEYKVTGEEYAEVRPDIKSSKHYRDDLEVGSWHAALSFARHQCIKKLGHYVDVFGGGFAVRRTDRMPNAFFIVEGPPEENGQLPDWASLDHRKRVPTELDGVIELVEVANED